MSARTPTAYEVFEAVERVKERLGNHIEDDVLEQIISVALEGWIAPRCLVCNDRTPMPTFTVCAVCYETHYRDLPTTNNYDANDGTEGSG